VRQGALDRLGGGNKGHQAQLAAALWADLGRHPPAVTAMPAPPCDHGNNAQAPLIPELRAAPELSGQHRILGAGRG